MAISSQTLKMLIDAGISGEQLVEIVQSIESDQQPKRSSGAERQARYRNKKTLQRDVTETVTEKVSPSSPLVPPSLSPAPLTLPPIIPPPSPSQTPARPLPAGLDAGIWEEFKAHRRQRKAGLTPIAESRALEKLDRMRKAGHDPTAVVRQSIENGWTGLFELKDHGKRKQSLQDQAKELLENGW